jgi:hypothetical protein
MSLERIRTLSHTDQQILAAIKHLEDEGTDTPEGDFEKVSDLSGFLPNLIAVSVNLFLSQYGFLEIKDGNYRMTSSANIPLEWYKNTDRYMTLAEACALLFVEIGEDGTLYVPDCVIQSLAHVLNAEAFQSDKWIPTMIQSFRNTSVFSEDSTVALEEIKSLLCDRDKTLFDEFIGSGRSSVISELDSFFEKLIVSEILVMQQSRSHATLKWVFDDLSRVVDIPSKYRKRSEDGEYLFVLGISDKYSMDVTAGVMSARLGVDVYFHKLWKDIDNPFHADTYHRYFFTDEFRVVPSIGLTSSERKILSSITDDAISTLPYKTREPSEPMEHAEACKKLDEELKGLCDDLPLDGETQTDEGHLGWEESLLSVLEGLVDSLPSNKKASVSKDTVDRKNEAKNSSREDSKDVGRELLSSLLNSIPSEKVDISLDSKGRKIVITY